MAQLIEKNFFEEKLLANPFEMYQWAIENDAILKMPGENFYGIFSAELVAEVLKNPMDFSNSGYIDMLNGRYADDPEIKAIYSKGYGHANVLLSADPPSHTRHRELVNLAFSRPRVEAMSGDIRQIINDLIDKFIESQSCEFIRDFAVPLPVKMIANQYGLGDVPIEKVKSWSDAIGDRSGGMATREREVECAHLIVEFHKAMEQRVNDRKVVPCDDLLSDLVNADIEGEHPLNDNELFSILQQLITAGNETTTAMLGLGMHVLLQNPDQIANLRADPSKIPNMVEEMLRYEGPVGGTIRVTSRDTELAGVSIPANSMIMVRLGSANRDNNLFENSNKFDPERKNASQHFAFGRGGVHVCIGSMLARRELTLAFEALLTRLDDIRLIAEPTYAVNMTTRAFASLNLGFKSSGKTWG